MTAPDKDFVDITQYISLQQFEELQRYIIKNGDRKTYRNIDNNNPHYHYKGFEVYLNPEDWQNTFCEENKSGFNEIVIYHPHEEVQYYHLRIVRKGDLGKKQIRQIQGLEELHVYLLGNSYTHIAIMKKQLINYYLKVLLEVLG